MSSGERVWVAVRIRPFQPHEAGHKKIVDSEDNTKVTLATPEGRKAYKFNAVIDENASQ